MLLIVKSFLLYICLLMHFHGILKLDEFKVSFALKLTLRLYFFLVVVLKRQAWLVAGFPFHLRMVRSSRDLYGWHIYSSNIKISWSNSKVSILFIFCNLIIWYANPSTGKNAGRLQDKYCLSLTSKDISIYIIYRTSYAWSLHLWYLKNYWREPKCTCYTCNMTSSILFDNHPPKVLQ